jgi:tRNA A37 threonylcarbamoyltransferase TsaD
LFYLNEPTESIAEKQNRKAPDFRRATDNRALRQQLALARKKNGFELRLEEKILCIDNAAMIGVLAERKLLAGMGASELDSDIKPGWELA